MLPVVNEDQFCKGWLRLEFVFDLSNNHRSMLILRIPLPLDIPVFDGANVMSLDFLIREIRAIFAARVGLSSSCRYSALAGLAVSARLSASTCVTSPPTFVQLRSETQGIGWRRNNPMQSRAL
jgi:hypothetical protein